MGVNRSKRFKKLNHPTTTTTTDDGGIPDWLVFELLLRLPLNRIFACRLVSKQWLWIASAPHFIRAYTSRAESASQPYWTVLPPCVLGSLRPSKYITPREIYLRRPRLCEIRLLPDSRPRGFGSYVVVGASDGLLLYYSCKRAATTSNNLASYNFYVSNPITRQWIKACELNGLPSSYVWEGWGFLTRADQDFVLRSYRIVRAVWPDAVTFDVYYSETGEWKKFTAALPRGPPGPGQPEMQASGAVLDGILHWAELELGVIAFDPEEANPNRQTRVIPRPRDVARPHDVLCLCQCVEYRGELRYVGGYEGRNCEFPGFSIWSWLGGDEWCIRHKIESSRLDYIASAFIRPVDFTITIESLFFDPCDPYVVYFVALSCYSCHYMFSYDLKSGRLWRRPDMMLREGGRVGLSWTLLLVLPPWPTRVAEKLLDGAVGVHLDY